jgi:hypothetical protein
MQHRLQGLLHLPTHEQLEHELSMHILPEVAKLVAGYAHLPKPELLLMHITSARTKFLTVSECLELVDATSSCRPAFFAYLHSMFEGIPPLAKWPCNMQYQALHNLLQNNRPARPCQMSLDWECCLQDHIDALRTLVPCTECVVAVLSNAQSLVDSLPRGEQTIAHRFKMARRAERMHLCFVGLGIAALSKVLFGVA